MLLVIIVVYILHRLVIIQMVLIMLLIILKLTCNNLCQIILNFHTTSNIEQTPFHISAAEQVHMPMKNYQGQTNMVSSANIYETPCANNFNTNQKMFHVFIHQQQIHNI